MKPIKIISGITVGICLLLNTPDAFGMNVSVTPIWEYGKTITITGDNINGDEPLYAELCIAYEVNVEEKKCYKERDLENVNWMENKLQFTTPKVVPARGLVSLSLEVKKQTCFTYAGCVDGSEQIWKDMGNFISLASLETVVDSKGKTPLTIEGSQTYTISGHLFGDEKATLLLRKGTASVTVAKDKISTWQNETITFKAPSNISSNAVGINTGGKAIWLELSKPTVKAKAPVKSSKSSPTSRVRRR